MMKRERITNAQIMEAINGLCNTVNELNDRVTKLEETKKTTTKSAPKARTTKASKATTTKKSTKSTSKAAPKETTTTKVKDDNELRIWEYEGAVNFNKTTLKKLLPYFEPKKYDGYYRWGLKSDGYNQKSYMGRRKAFCVFMATDGKYWDSDKAYKDGVRIDYSDNGAYYKAKALFEETFKYIKKSDR